MTSEIITTKVAFTSRSVAALQEKDLANRRPSMPSLTTTLGGTIAAVCSRCRSRHNYEFAMHRIIASALRRRANLDKVGCSNKQLPRGHKIGRRLKICRSRGVLQLIELQLSNIGPCLRHCHKTLVGSILGTAGNG